MNSRQIRLLQRSFALIEPVSDQVGTAFYEKLHELAPDIKPGSPDDMQAQQRKLMTFLGEFVKLQLRSLLTMPVTAANELEAAIPGVAELVADHAELGLDVEHFALAKQALLWSFAQQLGAQFDGPSAKAWSTAIDMISASMIRVMRGEAQDLAEEAPRVETDARVLESLFRQ